MSSHEFRAGVAHPYAARDIPVFERGSAASLNPATRAGLAEGHKGGVGSLGFHRTDRDRRPGTPVTAQLLGDPHPDRHALSEERRRMLAAKDERFKIAGSDERVIRGSRTQGRAMSKTPDIEKPRSYYVDISRGVAALEARRGEDVLLFPTVSEAARCLTGSMSPKNVKAIQNAASGVTKSAFGWTWTRLRSRRGANR